MSALEPKIFCVGFNKTGTLSLAHALEFLGFGPVAKPETLHSRYARFTRYPYRAICNRVLDHADYALPLEVAREFRCFKDRPWNIAPMYRLLDEAFPGSKFILTWRDPEDWWRSVENWLPQGTPAKTQRYLKHLGADAVDREQFLSGYNAYNAEVRAYFAGRADLCELNWKNGDGWAELCVFLGVPVPDEEFPHANRQEYRT